MTRIIAPNRSYTGVSAGVAFLNGEGSTDNPRLVEWFREHGYLVEEPEEKSREEVKPKARSRKKEV